MPKKNNSTYWKRSRRDSEKKNNFNRNAPTDEEKLSRSQSSETAKRMIEHFEKDAHPYQHGGSRSGKSSLRFYISLFLALAAVILIVLFILFHKGP